MATFTVDTLSDDPTAGLTLREALAAADGAAGADTIEFAAGIQGGTITLTGGQLVVGSDVTVDGGTGVTIDANELSRVLQQSNYTNVVLENLTITGGKSGVSGGGILSARLANLTLIDTTVIGNSTTGENASGGGIINFGMLTLIGSTVSGNSTTGGAAGGGGIYLSGGDLTLANSIVAGNGASGAGSDIGSTITSSNGHNIFGSDVAGNAVGDLENVATALLFSGGLADHGGSTQTIAILDDPTNPALGGALAAGAPDTDQRGAARPAPAGTDPDVGAFELTQSPPTEEIVGTKRADFLQGTSGGDVIRGLAGNDTLYGLPGDDRLFGDNGKDSLFGKAGIDQSTGGPGADRFVFRATAEAAPDGPVYEEILDFNRGQGDKIDLRGIDADVDAPGNQKFAFVGAAAISGPAQLHVEAFDGDFLVIGNVDADPAADFAIVVRAGLASLRASDFLL